MANLMIEATIYLVAAAAVGFMTAWLASRARWRQREAELTAHILQKWDEPEVTRSTPLRPQTKARREATPPTDPEVLVAELELGELDFELRTRREPLRPPASPARRQASTPVTLSLPESARSDQPARGDSRRSRIAAVLRTPEYSYPVEIVLDGSHHGGQLRALGLRSTLDLLRKCPGAREIASVAASTGINVRDLRRWAALADLMRMEHVRSVEARLLLEAGIDSSQALASEDAARVAARMATVSTAAPHTAPSVSTVASWIVNARALPPRLVD